MERLLVQICVYRPIRLDGVILASELGLWAQTLPPQTRIWLHHSDSVYDTCFTADIIFFIFILSGSVHFLLVWIRGVVLLADTFQISTKICDRGGDKWVFHCSVISNKWKVLNHSLTLTFKAQVQYYGCYANFKTFLLILDDKITLTDVSHVLSYSYEAFILV